MRILETLGTIAVSLSLLACMVVAAQTVIVVVSGAQESAPAGDRSQPIRRGDAVHDGNGVPWNYEHRPYKGWPYGQ